MLMSSISLGIGGEGKRSAGYPSPVWMAGLLFLLAAGWSCKGRAGQGPVVAGGQGQPDTGTHEHRTGRAQEHSSTGVPGQAFAGIKYENGTDKARALTLPDGSQAWMSPHTVITLSRVFGKGAREAELDGKAMFEVHGEPGRPFLLHTRNLVIEALEARFRVDAYRNTAGEEVDLLSGKLRVTKSYHSDTDNEPELLAPGEMVMINRDIDLMEKEKMDSATWRALYGKRQ
jgi:hypothetical protein